VPILSGAAGFFTNVQGGQTQLAPEINPVLLLPLGDRWLVESRAQFEGEFEQPEGGGSFGGKVSNEISYLQADYIANRFVTVAAGRFLIPFGIYNERLYPIWIRSLHPEPLIFSIATGSGNGGMLRGGFSLNKNVDLNYAAYFSAASTVHEFESDRSAGLRAGIFFPGERVEIGGSWQKSLQEERGDSFGAHFAWQPVAFVLNIRSEYAHSRQGSGYWVEGTYRLSQLHGWGGHLRHAELVGRAQQFFAGSIEEDEAVEYGVPDVNTTQADFGVNYYLRDGLKASASYGRQFSPDGNFNLWTVGVAYRFAFPLGPLGAK